MTGKPTDSDSLGAAKAWLRVRLGVGAKCPCCTQFSKIYERKINSTMARSLITLWNTAGRDFAHGPSLKGDTHEISQLVWWGLIEEEKKLRGDGGRAGWWRITDHGEDFVKNKVKVPKYARIYDSVCIGLSPEEFVTIQDALGTRFSYSDLMKGI